jgi:hypothetical protein
VGLFRDSTIWIWRAITTPASCKNTIGPIPKSLTYIKDIDFPTMAKFSEHDIGLPGVDIAIKPVRS